MSSQRRTPADDRGLASLVLPLPEDLWGDGWELDLDGGDEARDGIETPAREPCYPADFPDHAVTADAAVTYLRRPGGVVHAVSLVFDDRRTAARAWSLLIDEGFARCFAETVAEEIHLNGTLELLGPVLRPSSFTLDRAGRRTAAHRAVFSGVEEEGVLPVVLDFAVIVAGRAVVTLWAADPVHPGADDGWEHLVERVELRCEVAVVNE